MVPIHRWMSRWGATPFDLGRVMAGDGLVVNPTYSATMAVIVNAPPEYVWPWLVQIGYQRGGLYSYDWLDRLFGYLDRPSATSILREFQHLAVGDHIPLGRGPSWRRDFSSRRMLLGLKHRAAEALRAGSGTETHTNQRPARHTTGRTIHRDGPSSREHGCCWLRLCAPR